MRRAEPRDASELADLERDVFGGDSGGAWSVDSIRGLLEDRPHDERLHDKGSLVLVQPHAPPDENPRILAYAAFRTLLDEAELLRVAVHPEVRRRGVARVLILSGLEELDAQGVDVCHLEVRADNRAALGLYRDLGFERVGLRRGYYRDGTDAELWTLRLAYRASDQVSGEAERECG